MAKDREIVYEPHPVSAERKQELIAQGFKIIDSRFAPGGYAAPKKEQKAQSNPVSAEIDYDAMDADALHALAKERGVDVHHKAGADKVREALREADKE